MELGVFPELIVMLYIMFLYVGVGRVRSGVSWAVGRVRSGIYIQNFPKGLSDGCNNERGK